MLYRVLTRPSQRSATDVTQSDARSARVTLVQTLVVGARVFVEFALLARALCMMGVTAPSPPSSMVSSRSHTCCGPPSGALVGCSGRRVCVPHRQPALDLGKKESVRDQGGFYRARGRAPSFPRRIHPGLDLLGCERIS